MATVWCPFQPRCDVSKAQVWGSLTPIFQKGMSPLELCDQRKIIETEVLPVAYKDDFVLLVGPVVTDLNLVVTWLNHFKICRCLVWKKSIQEYVIKTFLFKTKERE